jgi:hypothetical protein
MFFHPTGLPPGGSRRSTLDEFPYRYVPPVGPLGREIVRRSYRHLRDRGLTVVQARNIVLDHAVNTFRSVARDD